MADDADMRSFLAALATWDADPSPLVAIQVCEAALKIWREPAPARDHLVGQFFHSRGERGEIVWQGEILSRDGQRYLVELFSWVDGARNGRKLVPVSDVQQWTIYASHVEMKSAYDEYSSAKYGRSTKGDAF
jgi:hypothetical protein